jgi:Family of unknown function (DUF6298)
MGTSNAVEKFMGHYTKSLASAIVLLTLVAALASSLPVNARARAKASFRLVPSSARIMVQREMQFFPKGASRRGLRWYVNGVTGGNATVGSISPTGLYRAPALVPPDGRVTVKAVEPNTSRAATAAVTIIYETQTGTPLRRSKANPRYFENSGGLIFLTGSHTWNDVQEQGASDPPAALDYNAYIAFLKSNNHNLTRLWAWDQPKSSCDSTPFYTEPFPWVRSGPGSASDGKPKFNLREFNSAYFDLLRRRVQQAQSSGIFVDVMLFEGYGVIQCGSGDDGFPFYSRNNVNGIDAARGAASWRKTGSFRNFRDFPFFKRYFCHHEWVTGTDQAVVAVQKAGVAKVLKTLNEFDNVLWEVANEAGANSTRWQREMIRFIREYEDKLPKQHPIGFTFQYGGTCSGETKTLFQSDADWISPGSDVGDYRGEKIGPAPNDGKKVIITDTDHLWGSGGSPLWVWKSFMRGMNILYMDVRFRRDGVPSRTDDTVRQGMGDVLTFSRRLPLAHLVPSLATCSTEFGMVDRGNEYVCLAPAGGTFTLDLSAAGDAYFSVAWFDVSARKSSATNVRVRGGQKASFSCPSGDHPCVLHAKRL